ncbi:MAG: hypothetical protein ACOH5I_10825 [Oligoflexus sp.]
MNDKEILNAIIRVVPQWYSCEGGSYNYVLENDMSSVVFCSHQPLTARLISLLDYVNEKLPIWKQQIPKIPTPSSISRIGEDLALKWLELHDPDVNWNKWVAYAESLRQKTHENVKVERNVIISTDKGQHDITSPNLQNVFDSLTAHPQVYMRVDKDMNFIDYDEILWSQVTDSTDYKFSPEFLQPLISIMKKDEYCAHLSSQGDMLIAGDKGILASCRKGLWFIYDVQSIRDSIVEIIGDYHVGCHLFELLLDLSYRRRGALLIFDPNKKVIDQVVNKESLICNEEMAFSDEARRLLAPRIKSIHMSEPSQTLRKKRLFLEVAGVDGALIFDTHEVLAFGAMVKFHPNVGAFFGARSAAAQSAVLWGGYAFKISVDGDITILFLDKHSSGRQAELRFM